MNNKHKVKLIGGNHNNKVVESTHVGEINITMPAYNKTIDTYTYSGEFIKENGQTIYIYNLLKQEPAE